MKNSLNFSQDDLVDVVAPARNLIEYSLEFDEYYIEDYDLNSLVDDIKVCRMSFVRMGLIFFKVKYLKLYKSEYSNFKEFCEQRCEISAWQVNRIIEAARVVYDLISFGFTEILPTCEAQCRMLVKLGKEELMEVWGKIIEELRGHEITANKIEDFVREYFNLPKKPKKIRIEEKLGEHIKERSNNLNLSVNEYLEEVTEFKKKEELEKPTKERIRDWLKDLVNLNGMEDSLARLFFKAMTLGVLYKT